MKVLIVEDEPLAAERLTNMLQKYDSSIEVLDTLDTVEEASQVMNKNQENLDIVFLDIQLADGKSFEIFDKIDYKKPIVFTTAYDEYALKAFKHNSIDYLLKPVKAEELSAALTKFNDINGNTIQASTIDEHLIKKLLKRKKNYKKRFIVKFGNRILFKMTDEIALFAAEDKICHLITHDTGKKYVIDHTLEELENEFLNPEEFFRISRQHIIHVNAIKELKGDSRHLQIIPKFACDYQLTVSRSKIDAFKKWIAS